MAKSVATYVTIARRYSFEMTKQQVTAVDHKPHKDNIHMLPSTVMKLTHSLMELGWFRPLNAKQVLTLPVGFLLSFAWHWNRGSVLYL